VAIKKLPLYMQNEPLTDPKYVDRLRYALNHVGDGMVEVSTNCSLLDRTKSRQIVAAGKNKNLTVILSFHGTRRTDYEEMMGLSYDKSLRNVRQFLEEAQVGGPQVVVHAYGDEAPIKEFWQTKCGTWGLVRYPRIKVIAYTNRAGNLRGKYEYQVKDASLKPCIRRTQWLHFNWKGDVILCCNDYENEVILGNVMKEKLQPIMDGIVPAVVRLAQQDQNFLCRRCDARCIGQ
jgi:hypothetical protein